ncbi:hypothetical protein [Streptomyces sp. NPDC058280]|uniref:hypothetical protein n=1 Tax=Streptomyces sp. NPDC058280 TaxID=3346419 RepID=UPI0036E9F158
MDVEIPPHVRDTATELRAGVPYALKVLTGQLADDPEMGRPSGLPGVLTVMVDGDVFEDCPALAIGYIREPNRIEVRYVKLAPSAEPVADAQDQDQDQPAGPAATRSPDGRQPTPGSASSAGSSTMPPTPTLRSAPA